MRPANRLIAAAMIALAGTTSFGALMTGAASAYDTQKEMLRTADEALAAVTRIQAARLAIMDNRIDDAKSLVSEATTQLAEAETGRMIVDTDNPAADPSYLPFDMSMSLTEGYSATRENVLALQKAEGLMQTAQPDEAIEVLRLASIDVNVQAALLPADASLRHLEDAQALLTEGKYHDANLALKAIQDSIIVRMFSIDAIPAQGDLE